MSLFRLRPALVGALLLLSIMTAWGQAPTTGVPTTVLRTERGGIGTFWRGPEWLFDAWNGTSEVSVRLTGPAGLVASIAFKSPQGALGPGPYEAATWFSPQSASPGLLFLEPGAGCAQVSGRFVVLELELVTGTSSIDRFAADFEQTCDGSAPVFGEIRLNSALPLRFEKPAGSTAPDPFAFLGRSGVLPGVVVESDEAGIHGNNALAPIVVAGGEYSLNGAPYTSAPGTASHGDRVRVRTTSSSTPGATAAATLTVGGVTATFVATTYLPAVPATVLYFESAPGHFVGQGRTVEEFAPRIVVSPALVSQDRAWLEIGGQGGTYYSLQLIAPAGQLLRAGTYEAAKTSPLYGEPELRFSANSRSCAPATGRFVILEIEWVLGELERLAANFEQTCASGETLFGEVRWNSSVPISTRKPADTSLPEPFALLPQGPVIPGAVVTSNATTIYGVNSPVPLSIIGGEYSLNGGAFTSVPGSAQNRDSVRVRVTASSLAGAAQSAVLNAGGRSATFTATTFSPDVPLTALAFRSSAGDSIGEGQTRIMMAPAARIAAVRNFANGVRVTALSHEGTSWALEVAAAAGAVLSRGSYGPVGNFPWQGDALPGLSFDGNGRACSTIDGRFVVHEAVYASDGSVERFAADFEQRCEAVGPPLLGEVRINSLVPFGVLAAGPCPGKDIDGDGLSDCAEWLGLSNPFVRDNDIFADARLFAMQQYRDFLAREGDAGGIDHWTAQLAGAMTRTQVVETFLRSAEFEGRIAPVARLYFAYFQRIPDHGGLQFWIGQYAGGVSLPAISELFAQSEEFQGRYGTLDDAQFVDLVYRSVMGRAPDASGLAFWTGRLARRELTRGEVMLAFSESAEYRALIGAEVLVTMAYVGMLRRAPEEGGFAFWVGYLDAGQSPQALIDAFLRAAEYRARFLP